MPTMKLTRDWWDFANGNRCLARAGSIVIVSEKGARIILDKGVGKLISPTNKQPNGKT